MKKLSIILSILILTLLVLPMLAHAEVLGALPEVGNPHFIAVDNENLYVLEKASVYIYDLKDLTLKKKFGKKGEGPKEFRLGFGEQNLILFPQKENLLIHSIGKITYFTRTGEYIKEMALPSNLRLMNVMAQSIGDNNFVAQSVKFDTKNQSATVTLTLYDKDFKEIKALHQIPFEQRGGKSLLPTVQPLIYVNGDKVVAMGEKDVFSLYVFDSKGNKTATIERDYDRLDLGDSYKEKIHTFFKTFPSLRQYYEEMKQRIAFKDKLPAIQAYWASDQTVYVMTYKEKDGKCEFFVYDFDGKLKKHLYLPVNFTYEIRPTPICFKNNVFYQIIENEDSEEFELHAIKVL